MLFWLSLVSFLSLSSFTENSQMSFRGMGPTFSISSENSLAHMSFQESQSPLVKERWVKQEILKTQKPPLQATELKTLSEPFLMASIPASYKLPVIKLPVDEKRKEGTRGKELSLAQQKPPSSFKGPSQTGLKRDEKSIKKRFVVLKTKAPKSPKKDLTKPSVFFEGEIQLSSFFRRKDLRVSVYRELENIRKEEVFLETKDLRASYQLKTQEPMGFLVAEVYDSLGRTLGRVRSSFLNQFGKQNFKIEPSWGISGKAVSLVHSQPLSKAKMFLEPFSFEESFFSEKSGDFSYARLLNGSSYTLTGFGSEKFLKHIHLGVAGEEHRASFFTKAFINAFLDQVLESPIYPQEVSVIWGHVLSRGKPQKGVRVEMAGVSEEPIYFNGFFPDPSLKTTSENGLFAFLVTKEGFCPLRALGKEIYPAEMTFCKKGAVAHVNINLGSPQNVKISAQDPFQGPSREEISFGFFGEEDRFLTSKDRDLEISRYFQKGEAWLQVEAKEGYEPLRFQVLKRASHIEIPLISSQWLLEVLSHGSERVKSSEGVLVGFVETNKAFEVFLDGESAGKKTIFFDGKGQVLLDSQKIPQGFVLPSLSLGFHQVTLFFEDTEDFINKVIFVDPFWVHVFVEEVSFLK